MRTLLAPTALALAVLAASGASAGCMVGKIAELPVTMSGLQPTVRVGINGTEVRLLADSGGFYSMISPGTASELKLHTQPAPSWFSLKGIGGVTDASVTTVKAFTLGPTTLRDISFIVGGSEVGAGLGGILGRNILTIADTEYDLANGVIRLMRPSGCGDRNLAYWTAGTTKVVSTVDLLPDASQLPQASIPVIVNGVRLKAVLDSGSSTSVLFLGGARKAGVAIGAAATAQGESRGVGRRAVATYSAPLNDLKIGDEEIKSTRIRVLETNLETNDMLLGADFFLSHRIFIAKSQQRVYFTYNGGPVFNLIATRPEPAAPVTGAAPSPAGTDPSAPAAEPTDAAGFSRRGQAYAARRDFAHALPDLDRAVALAPDNADYVYQRGMARLASAQVFLAMADIEQALKLRPEDTAALLARAELRFIGHDPAGATHDLDEVAKLAAPSADIRLSLAGLYDRANRMDAAVEQYTLWIAAHPEDSRRPSALNGRCWARALLDRDLDKALADCNGAVRANPKNFGFLDSRGLVFLRRGEFDKAIADYDASLALHPQTPWSLYGRGLAKTRSGDAAGGKADIAAALAISPTVAAQAERYGLKP